MRTIIAAVLLSACSGPGASRATAFEIVSDKTGEPVVVLDWMHVFGEGIGLPVVAMKIYYVKRRAAQHAAQLIFTSASGHCWEFSEKTTIAVGIDGRRVGLGRARHEKGNISFVNWSYLFPGAVGMACSETLTVEITPDLAAELGGADSITIELGRYSIEFLPNHIESMRQFGALLGPSQPATSATR